MKNTIPNITNSTLYREIISRKVACYFISPHLDDAVFSTASLLSNLVDNNIPVTIINVFSEASPKPYTLSVHKFLWQCGYYNADQLFADRRKEDKHVISQLGAQVKNLGFVDALWRRKKVSGIRNLLGRYIGEFTYVYPAYRLGLAQGIVSPYDQNLPALIGSKLLGIIPKRAIIFCPLAIGRHVDHLIVRDACQATFANNRVVYWSDYPYEKEKPNEEVFITDNNLRRYQLPNNSAKKNMLINGYASQLKVIFGGVIDHSQVKETYYFHQ